MGRLFDPYAPDMQREARRICAECVRTNDYAFFSPEGFARWQAPGFSANPREMPHDMPYGSFTPGCRIYPKGTRYALWRATWYENEDDELSTQTDGVFMDLILLPEQHIVLQRRVHIHRLPDQHIFHGGKS